MMKAKEDISIFKELVLILLWFGISLEKEKFRESALLRSKLWLFSLPWNTCC